MGFLLYSPITKSEDVAQIVSDNSSDKLVRVVLIVSANTELTIPEVHDRVQVCAGIAPGVVRSRLVTDPSLDRSRPGNPCPPHQEPFDQLQGLHQNYDYRRW